MVLEQLQGSVFDILIESMIMWLSFLMALFVKA
jgi:hypothetical protein